MEDGKNIMDLVRSKLSSGAHRKQVQDYLIRQGYSDEQIREIFSQIDNNTNDLKNQINTELNYKLDIMLYLLSGLLFILLSFLFDKLLEGTILMLIYSVTYYFSSIIFVKRVKYFKLYLITINLIYILYSFILIPELLLLLIIANIFSIHYYLNIKENILYDKINLIFLTTQFIVTILVLLLLYILGVSVFNLFDVIHLGQLFLLLSVFKYIIILLFFYISIFLIFNLFNKFDFHAYFKFNTKFMKILNKFSTKEEKLNQSIFKVSAMFFVILFIPLLFLSVILSINYYNNMTDIYENFLLLKQKDLELNYYEDSYLESEVLDGYDEFDLRSISKELSLNEFNRFVDNILLQNSYYDLNRIYRNCNSELICKKNSTSLPREFLSERFYIISAVKDGNLDIYFLKENKSKIRNRELILKNYNELKQTLIYKEVNLDFKELLNDIYSKKIPEKTNSEIIIGFFNGDNLDKMIYEILYLTRIGLESADIYAAREVMVNEYSQIDGSYYNTSMDVSALREQHLEGEVTRARILTHNNYYSNQSSERVPLSVHIKNLNNELSKLETKKQSDSNHENSNFTNRNIFDLSPPLNYFLSPILLKVDLVQSWTNIDLKANNLRETILNRYDRLDDNESQISKTIRFSILIDRID